MLSKGALERALAAAGLSAPVRWDEVTESTNTTALAMAAAGTPPWTLVAAGHQTAGRGRHGRTWVDRPGRALMCSIVLRPGWEPERLGLVSLAAGAAMAEAASEASGLVVRCRWPNDLLVADGKIGGILAESEVAEGRVRHVVVGAGVNLEAPQDVPGAGAIGKVDQEGVLAAYLSRLRGLMDGPPEQVLARWRAVSDTLGRTIEGTAVGGDAVRGVAAELDEMGGLVIDSPSGRATLRFGDVRYLEHVSREPRGLLQRLSRDARGALARADQIAVELGHQRVEPGHLLVALAEVGPSGGTRGLASVRFQAGRAREDLVRIFEGSARRPSGAGRLGRALLGNYPPATKRVLTASVRIAVGLGHDWIGVEHLLLAILERNDREVASMLSSQQASADTIREALLGALPPSGRRLRGRRRPR